MGVIREKRQVSGPRPVGVIRRDTGVGEKYKAIAEASAKLTSLAVEELGRSAAIQGEQRAQALTASQITAINPKTGKPEALDFIRDNAFIGRVGLEAYQRVVNERFQAEISQDIKEKAGEIALKFENDPYSVEKYEDQMNTYLQELAKSSEVDGKATAYTNFIATQGAEYITATKLSMMQERQRRERAKLANSHVNQNLEQTDAAYELGKGLNFEKFDLALPASVDRNTDLENANIFQQGSATAHSSQMRESFASGVLDKLIGGATKLQRAKIIAALELGNTDKLHGATKEVVDKAISYLDSSNRASVISSAKAARAAVDSVQATELAIENQRISDARDSVLDAFNTSGDALSSQNFNSIVGAYNQQGPDGSINFSAVEEAIIASVNGTNDEIDKINADGFLSSTSKEAQRRDARESILAPLLAIGARDGNADQFRLAITRQDPSALQNLTEFQASIVEAIRSEDFPYLPEDEAFVSTFLSGSVNQQKETVDNYIETQEFKGRIDDFVGNTKANLSTDDTYDGLIDEINKHTKLTGPDKDKQKAKLKLGLVYSGINKFPNPSSSSLNALQQYIASSGVNNLGLTDAQKAAADSILQNVDGDNRQKVLGDIGARQANFKTNELEAEQKLKLVEKQKKLARDSVSGGTIKTKDHREHIDTVVLPKLGLSIYNPDSATEELYGVLRNTMSQELINVFKAMAGGTQAFPDGTASLMLKHFGRLRYDMDESGKINRIGDLLTGEEYGILEDALMITSLATGDVSVGTVIKDIKASISDPVAQESYKRTFASDKVKNSGNTPAYDYLYARYKDATIARELEPLAEYFAKVGNNKTQIGERLDNVINENYAASQYVVDPSMPPSMMGKSKNALSIRYPDKEERDEFIRIVQSELPNGFVLADITGAKATEAQGMERLVGELATGDVGIQLREETRVYLVPFGGAKDANYYVYFQDNETKELRPLIYNKPTYDPTTSQIVDELVFPMYDSETTKAWKDRRILENERKAQQKAERNQATFQELNRKAQETPSGRALGRSILGGL